MENPFFLVRTITGFGWPLLLRRSFVTAEHSLKVCFKLEFYLDEETTHIPTPNPLQPKGAREDAGHLA